MTSRALRTITTLILLTRVVSALEATDESNRELARQYVEDGDTDFDAGRFVEARAKLSKAFELLKWPTIALKAAQACAAEGQLADAVRLYRDAIALQPDASWPKKAQNVQLLEEARRSAQIELDTLLPRVPTVVIQVRGANLNEVELVVDGNRVLNAMSSTPRELNPGTHTLVAKAAGGRAVSEVVNLLASEHKTITLRLPESRELEPRAFVVPPHGVAPPPSDQPTRSPVPKSPASNLRTYGWIALGLGATGLAVGTAAGTISLIKHSELRAKGCNEDYQCPSEVYPSQTQSYDRWRLVSTVGFVFGGVSAASGLTLLLLAPKREPSPRVSIGFAPASLEFRGTF